MKQLPSRRLIKTHLAPKKLPKSIFQKKAKVSVAFKVSIMILGHSVRGTGRAGLRCESRSVKDTDYSLEILLVTQPSDVSKRALSPIMQLGFIFYRKIRTSKKYFLSSYKSDFEQ